MGVGRLFIAFLNYITQIIVAGNVYGLDLHTGNCVRIANGNQPGTTATAVTFDEETNELYCGNEFGTVRAWQS